MRYWQKLFERIEADLPKLLHKGGWRGVVRGDDHHAHRIFKVYEGYVVSFDRYIGENPKHRFPWFQGPAMGRVLEGTLTIGLCDALRLDHRFPLPKRIRENGLFRIGPGQPFFVRPLYLTTRLINESSLVLLVRRLSRSKRRREAMEYYPRLTQNRMKFLLDMTRKYYP